MKHVEFVQGKITDSARCKILRVLTDIPEGFSLEEVHREPGVIEFRIWHPSFPVTADGDCYPATDFAQFRPPPRGQTPTEFMETVSEGTIRLLTRITICPRCNKSIGSHAWMLMHPGIPVHISCPKDNRTPEIVVGLQADRERAQPLIVEGKQDE